MNADGVMSAYIQANTDGRLHDATEPSLAPLNRGYLYGDAIYEVWRTYHGVLFAWEEHWLRLERSAASLHFALPVTRADILAQIIRTVTAFRERVPEARDVYVRLQIARGAGAIGLDTALAGAVSWVLLVQENKLYPVDKYQAGLRLTIVRSLRRNPAEALNPAWKTGNYLNNLLCLREGRERGADEVVILNQAGAITEAAVSNLAFVRRGVLVTPPPSAGLLPGITRQLLLGPVALRAGVKVVEENVFPEDLRECEEAMLLSTTKDLTPIAAIDEYRFGVGIGTVMERLKRAFAVYTVRYADEHPAERLF